MRRSAWVALGIALATVASAQRVEVLSVDAPSYYPSGNARPVKVAVVNDGPPTKAVLEIAAYGNVVRKAFTLPSGPSSVMLHPRLQDGGGGYATLTTERSSDGFAFSSNDSGPTSSNEQVVLVIGQPRVVKVNGRPVAVSSPEDAPSRSEVYEALSLVVAESGAQSMSDAAARALHQFVIGGGTLVFGGVDVAADPRLSDLSPGKVGSPRFVGLGRTIVLPGGTDSPRIHRNEAFATMNRNLSQQSMQSSNRIDDGYSPISLIGLDKPANPFTTEMPSVWTVGYLLVGFIVVVIPLNFLVLRKMKRAEWAWITAPVMGLAFASYLMKTGTPLGKMPASHMLHGTLIADAGVSEGRFHGNTTYFAPQAGTLRLAMRGYERIGASGDKAMRRKGDGLDPWENGNGTVTTETIAVRNLAFGQVDFARAVPKAGTWFRLTNVAKDVVRVENRSPHRFLGGYLEWRGRQAHVRDIRPGGTAMVTGFEFPKVVTKSSQPVDSIRIGRKRDPRIALIGWLKGLDPGPQVGVAIPNFGFKSQAVGLVFTAPEAP